MQSGAFSDHILCEKHEGLTAKVDKYAVEFVRRVNTEWRARGGGDTLEISNPQPELIRRFALLTIWREVASRHEKGLSLGPYADQMSDYIFNDGHALEWPVVVQRTNFTLPGQEAIDFALHPFRIRFADRSAWTFTVAGVAFIIVSDQRGIPSIFEEWIADTHDPARVTVSHTEHITDVGMLKALMSKLGKSRKR